ncbi:hypothetical protein O3M35_007322 [Rhynocoris fuscipes]|uniref:Uncharacterized protein n=1 Tax=Rhynocoris fuscipes TaxID=488301 RepID=A0AAW1DBI7_9HEMI
MNLVKQCERRQNPKATVRELAVGSRTQADVGMKNFGKCKITAVYRLDEVLVKDIFVDNGIPLQSVLLRKLVSAIAVNAAVNR